MHRTSFSFLAGDVHFYWCFLKYLKYLTKKQLYSNKIANLSQKNFWLALQMMLNHKERHESLNWFIYLLFLFSFDYTGSEFAVYTDVGLCWRGSVRSIAHLIRRIIWKSVGLSNSRPPSLLHSLLTPCLTNWTNYFCLCRGEDSKQLLDQ